ncbi:TPA: hypothetical protein ACXA0Y_004229, partial [Acinetobacter baumannii]
ISMSYLFLSCTEIKKKLRDQAKMNIPTYQFLREKAEKRNIDPTSPLVFIEPDKKETI